MHTRCARGGMFDGSRRGCIVRGAAFLNCSFQLNKGKSDERNDRFGSLCVLFGRGGK